MKIRAAVAAVAAVAAWGLAGTGAAGPAKPAGAEAVLAAMKKGRDALARLQDADGAWGVHIPKAKDKPPEYQPDVGVTALCLSALAKAPACCNPEPGKPPPPCDHASGSGRTQYKAAIDKAVKFILSRRRPDGSFADPDGMTVNYKTCVVLMALAEVDGKRFNAEITGAKDAIVKAIRLEPGDARNFGGAGYLPGEKGRGADLNNTVFAAEAIRRAEELGINVDPQVYEAMKAYVSRVQNLEMTNDILKDLNRGVRPEDRGGFPYRPEESKANEGEPIVLPDGRKVYVSYGSMTYAGLLSFIYAHVDPKDKRVQAAWDWISRNYTLDENPGMATARNPARKHEGLYYYYHTFAKACAAYGREEVVDAKGLHHDWARELAAKLVGIQRPDGTWINEADRWYEGYPALTTSYILLALEHCVKGMK